MKTSILKTSAALLLLLSSALCLAHTTIIGASPKSGSVLEQSPPVIDIQFHDEARLTSVVVVEAGKNERHLEFSPKNSATAFKLLNPELKAGRNEIQWKALSHDGHVVSGSLVFTIK